MNNKVHAGDFGNRAAEFENHEIEELEQSELGGKDESQLSSEEIEYTHEETIIALGNRYDELNELKEGEDKGKEQAADNSGAMEEVRERVEEMFTPAEKEIEESGEVVKKIRNERGVLVKGGGIVEANAGDMRELSRRQRAIESEIDRLERRALDLPDKEPKEANIDKFEPNLKKIEAELENAKERFAEKFIERSVEAVIEHFDEQFEKSENGDNARDLVELKTEKDIERAAKDFIEGGKPDFGFQAMLEISWFEEDGERVRYITGYTVEVQGTKDKSTEKSTAGGQPLVSSKGRDTLFRKKLEREINKETEE